MPRIWGNGWKSHSKLKFNVQNHQCYQCDEVGQYMRDCLKYESKTVKLEFAYNNNVVTTSNNSYSDVNYVLAITTNFIK